MQCSIEFENNPSKVIQTGQQLCATIHLTLNESTKVRGVFIIISGKVFTRGPSGYANRSKVPTGEEKYSILEQTYLIGGSNDEIELSPGTHEYTFKCVVPHLIPASFEGKYGHIRYRARVFLDRSLWPDKEFEIPFTVVNQIDLNTDPTLCEPVVLTTNKTFYMCSLLSCTTSEPLEIGGRIPRGGYAPGEVIDVILNVNNKSVQRVSEFTVQLVKEIKYSINKNKSSFKAEKFIIAQEYARGCDAFREDDIHASIVIPFSTAIDNKISNLIKVHHFIRIMASVSFFHSDPEIRLPVIIGTNPISDNSTIYTC